MSTISKSLKSSNEFEGKSIENSNNRLNTYYKFLFVQIISSLSLSENDAENELDIFKFPPISSTKGTCCEKPNEILFKKPTFYSAYSFAGVGGFFDSSSS